jgi:hypothetical protein
MAPLSLKRPLPAYLEYASDILANMNYRLMRLDERGLWDTMRKECWVNGCVPSNPHELAVILNLPFEIVQSAFTCRVSDFFRKEGELLFSDELDNYRADVLQRREQMVKGGSKGGQQTQKINREAKGTLQAPLEGGAKGLNREEMQREEMRGKESPSDGVSSEEITEWLKDYEKA